MPISQSVLPAFLVRRIQQFRNFVSYAREFGLRGACDVVRRRFGSSVYFVHSKGFSHPFFCRQDSSDLSMLRGVIGRDELRLSLSSVPKLIVDAGANVGFATRSFQRQFPLADIVAIEPDARNCEMFRRNVTVGTNVQLYHAAVWWRSSDVRISNADAPSASFQVEEVTNEDVSAIRGITIPDLINKHGPVDVLKLDIEGAEFPLLTRPPLNWLREVGLIVVETHDKIFPGSSQKIADALGVWAQRTFRQGEYTVFDLKGIWQ